MTKGRVNEIDLLRFFAALSVVFYHYAFRGQAADDLSVMSYPLLVRFAKYGYLSVNLFFMISGFVILMTASEGSLKKFLASRATRLYPAFWICCTITFLVTLIIGGERFTATGDQYLVNLTMLSEFFNVEPIDWAYWSLFVEIKFYVLIAIILFAGKISWTQHILIAWLAASIYLEFIYRNGHLYYWLNVNYAAYFIAGAACFLIYTKGLSWSRVVIIAIAWGLAVAQLGSDIMYREKHFKTPVNDLLIAGIITAFFLIMLLISMRKTGIMGRIRWSGIGMLTYPLYLLHQNVGFMIFNAAHPAVDTHVLFWGVILLMIAMAYIISRLEAGISPLLGKALNRSSIPENKSM